MDSDDRHFQVLESDRTKRNHSSSGRANLCAAQRATCLRSEVHAVEFFWAPTNSACRSVVFIAGIVSARLRVGANSSRSKFLCQARTGRDPLPNIPDTAGYIWRKSRLAFLGDWESSLDKIAIFNIGAYHSKAFTDHDVLASLPSSRVALDWAQSVLFSEAEVGKRVVICMRAANYWGLRVGQRYGVSLFTPVTTRGGHMIKGPMRQRIEKAAREVLA
jgi:hypothetical protein